MALADEAAGVSDDPAHVAVTASHAVAMGQSNLLPIATRPAGAGDPSVGGSNDRRTITGTEVDPAMESGEPQDRVDTDAEARSDPGRHRPGHRSHLAPRPIGVDPL